MALAKENHWYALFVATGEEDRVKEKISFKLRNELRPLVPKRKIRERKDGKWSYKIRLLFPGYILLNGCMDDSRYSLIRDIPGVIRLLKDSDGPLTIREEEIKVILRLTEDGGEIIGTSEAYVENGAVIVTCGPLSGLEGHIRSFDKRKGRAKVLLNLLGEPRVVELSVSMVQPA